MVNWDRILFPKSLYLEDHPIRRAPRWYYPVVFIVVGLLLLAALGVAILRVL